MAYAYEINDGTGRGKNNRPVWFKEFDDPIMDRTKATSFPTIFQYFHVLLVYLTNNDFRRPLFLFFIFILLAPRAFIL